MTRAAQQPTFILRLRLMTGVDGIKALRLALKALRRRFGLRCVGVVQGAAGVTPASDRHRAGRTPAPPGWPPRRGIPGWAAGLENTAEYFLMSIIRPRANTSVRAAARSPNSMAALCFTAETAVSLAAYYFSRAVAAE